MDDSDSAIQGSIEGTLVRGGTSRGLFVRGDDLPPEGDVRDALLVELFGSPDPIQVDGIGGGKSHTSKSMVVDPSDAAGVDVDYTFGQVEVEEPSVAYGSNCGNLTAAIGVYALLEGMVPAEEPETTLTLRNTNTGTVVEQTVPVRDGEPDVYGDYAIDGVPGTGSRIDSRFLDPAGAATDELLPAGPRVELSVDGDAVEASIVDVTNPNVFVRASDVGMSGTELPAEIESDPGLGDRLERIRSAAAARLGFVDDPADATAESPDIPFIAVVSEPQSYECSIDGSVDGDEIDVTARIMSNQHPHHAYAVTGAMCLAAAARIPGTVPNECARPGEGEVRIGHPKGRIAIGVSVDADAPAVESVTMSRTARPLFHGSVYYRYVDELEALGPAAAPEPRTD